MPSKKRRIALTVPDELDEVLTALSDETGQPKTAIILEVLAETMPTFQSTLLAIREAKQGRVGSSLNAMAQMLKDVGFVLDEAQHDFFNFKRKHDDKG